MLDSVSNGAKLVGSIIVALTSLVGLVMYIATGNANAQKALDNSKENQTDIETVERSQYEMKSDIRSIKESQAETNKDVSEIKDDVNDIQKDILQVKNYLMKLSN